MMRMQNIKNLLLVLVLVAFSCSTSGKDDQRSGDDGKAAGWTITISGKVGFPQPGEAISIRELKDSGPGTWQDTIRVKSNNTFSKKITLTQPGYYRLNFFNRQMVNLILYKSDIIVNADGNSAQGFFEIKGSPDLELIRQVQDLQAKANTAPEMAKINQDYSAAAKNKDERKMLEVRQAYFALMKTYNDQIAELMVKGSPSLAVINLLQSNSLDKDKYFSTYVTIAEKLKKEWPNFDHAKNFVAFVNKLKATAIGQPAPEIVLPDPTGKVVALSSFKGKYVLVDFWAKWCGPCRDENPNVVRAYNKYKDKGFTVFGVSLDRTKEDWLKAIEEDGLTWTHVSDLKFWQSEAAKTYGITGIPFSILVDPNGIIIDKNLRGAELHQKLEEILNKK